MNESALCFCLLRTQINFTVAIDFTASNGEPPSKHTHRHFECAHTLRDPHIKTRKVRWLPRERLFKYMQMGESSVS